MGSEFVLAVVFVLCFVALWIWMALIGAFDDLLLRAAITRKVREGWERDE